VIIAEFIAVERFALVDAFADIAGLPDSRFSSSGNAGFAAIAPFVKH
jgi:hypothetical protein